ncbi:MAG: UDP-N-acetylmuramoyl-L-alanine--D-glutamate ligase, partial [Aliidongia sp.]
MIALSAFRDRTLAVLGLARSGLAAVEALQAGGANVLAWDDDAATRNNLAEKGVALVDLALLDPAGWAALVMSPGIPLTHPTPHPVVARVQEAGVPVIGDIELLWRAETGARFLGITGTNGKSTTTTLIGHILSATGCSVAIGGNLGTPVLSLPTLDDDGTYVIEMSSYQLDLIDRTRFAVSILLNITPDHLDRHGDMAGYVAAKRRIFRNQIEGDTAIIGVDDDWCRTLADELETAEARVVRVSTERVVPGGVYVLDGRLIDDTAGDRRSIIDLRLIASLPGSHNWQNAAVAYAACRACHLDIDMIATALASFAGLAHRQELVARHGRVRFVNDSKATNADATAKALACYDAIHWIVGGIAKAGGIASLAPFFPRIRHAYLIGSAAQQFQETLGVAVPSTLCDDLPAAVRAAAAA